MKKTVQFLGLLLLAVVMLAGCGEKKNTDENSAAGNPEEVADSTRLDSAITEIADSAAAVIESVVDSATAAAKEALGN